MACALAVAVSCSGDDPQLGGTQQAHTDPPPLPDFPDDTFVPTDPVGYLAGSGEVSPSGQASYSIPLAVPPGRLGIEPKLALVYNSASGNGALGVGWGLAGFSEIKRCNKVVASEKVADGVDWDASDTFCLSGEKLVGGAVMPDQTRAFRTERDSFADIRAFYPNGDTSKEPVRFEVRDRTGVRSNYKAYGARRLTTSSQGLVTPELRTAIWLLDTVTDRSGNQMKLDYEHDHEIVPPYGFAYRPSKVSYTSHPTEGGADRWVSFIYEDRVMDQPLHFAAGIRTAMTKKLARIEMWAPLEPGLQAALAWQYNIGYRLSDVSSRLLLEKVEQCDAKNVCTWSKEFSWASNGSDAMPDMPMTTTVIDDEVNRCKLTIGQDSTCAPIYFRYPPGAKPEEGEVDAASPMLVGDFDADGRDDVLYWDTWAISEDPTLDPYDPYIFGKLKWRASVRMSKSGPVSHKYDVGQAIAKLAEAPFSNAIYSFTGLNIAQSRVIDIEGDGKHELYMAKDVFGVGTEYALHRWNGGTNEFEIDGSFEVKRDVNFADLDGDGRVDLIENIGNQWNYRINTGGAFGSAVATGVAYTGEDQDSTTTEQCYGAPVVADFDGDGRGEVLVPGPPPCSQQVRIGLDDNGAVTSQMVTWPQLLPTTTDSQAAAQFKPCRMADVNGDGLVDILCATALRINTGRGFLAPVATNSGPVGPVIPADVNNDGRSDFFTAGGGSLYLSQAGVGNPAAFWHIDVEPSAIGKAGDFDGDGVSEMLALVPNEDDTDYGQAQKVMQLRAFPSAADLDVITEVRDEGAGHPRERFVWSRTWNEAPSSQSCTYPQNCVLRGMPVVREHRRSQGEALAPNERVTRFTYDKPRRDVIGRGFLGFALRIEVFEETFGRRVTMVDNETRVEFNGHQVYPLSTLSVVEVTPILEQPQLLPMPAPTGTVRAESRAMQPVDEVVFPTADSYVTRRSTWKSQEGEANATITTEGALLTTALVVHRERTGAFLYDAYNNVETETAGTTGGVFRMRSATYDNDTTNWQLGMLRKTLDWSWTSGQGQPPARHFEREYDSKGRLWRLTREPNDAGSLWQRHELEHDGRGVIDMVTTTVKTGEPARVYEYFYDDAGINVERARNPEGHWFEQVSSPAYGVPAVLVDENGVETTFKYDGLGRPREVKHQGASTVSKYLKPYVVAGNVAGIQEVGSSTDLSKWTTISDELGRPIEEHTLAFDGVTMAVERITYNLLGSATKQSRPGAGAPAAEAYELTYDMLGRLVREKAPDGATLQYTHSRTPTYGETLMKDADARESVVRSDRDGRVIRKEERLGSKPGDQIYTHFVYGPFDEVEQATDHLGNQVKMAHDRVGRQESLTDPDAGHTRFTYTGFDDLRTELNALSQTSTYTYDRLSRLTGVINVDGSTVYTWDWGPNALGRLSRTESPDGIVSELAFNANGQLTAETTIVNGLNPAQLTIGFTYDNEGRHLTTKYPVVAQFAPLEVRNVYGVAGYLRQRIDASTFQPFWKVEERQLDGALKRSKQGDNLEVTRGHHPSTGRLTSVVAKNLASSATLMSLGYDHYPSGNIKTRTDASVQRKETFTYDGIDRLKTWKVESTSSAFQTRNTEYKYDVLGNMTEVLANGASLAKLTYTGTKPHAVSTIGGQPVTHDAAGRQRVSPRRDVEYNAFHLPIEVTDKQGGGVATFRYDAHGRRVRKTVTGGWNPGETTYAGSLYERRQVQAGTDHVFYIHGEHGVIQQIVFRQGVGTSKQWIIGDGHGSTSAVLDQNLIVVQRRFTEPYGGPVGVNGAPVLPPATKITVGFTGHEEEQELGLINMRGRVYDPTQRRFLTPDPIIGNALSSQAYNRYAYVLDNPMRYVDPSGYKFIPLDRPPGAPEPEEGELIGHWVTAFGTVYKVYKGMSDAGGSVPGSDAHTGPTEAEVARGNELGNQQFGNDLRAAYGDQRLAQHGGADSGPRSVLDAGEGAAGTQQPPKPSDGGAGTTQTSERQRTPEEAAADQAAADQVFVGFMRAGSIICPPVGLIFTIYQIAEWDRDRAPGPLTVEDLDMIMGAKGAISPRPIRNQHLAGKRHPVTGVPFDKHGFPDFKKAGVVIKSVPIKFTGNREKDFAAANKAARWKDGKQPANTTWHHHQDCKTMQLVPSWIHDATGHTGGFSICK